MKRPRTKATLAARASKICVTFFTHKPIQKRESQKTPHVKCFGKYIPISQEQLTQLESTTQIYML